ncbi:nucleotidyltransferase family protein [Paenibacillus sepulcri]|uniref:Nucleotidyltransferase family protein n=1 Tax=Paenibacillus sepulcri TaxID=359917 RepID=A0ABS7BVB1_9BACL|nr:nucleotidyltransferase family protein [Paenibacillus sepulcri]
MNKTSKLDLSVFSKEFMLMLSFAGADPDPELQESLLQNAGPVDWEKFIQLVRHHRVYPTVYLQTKRMDRQWLPAEVVDALQHDYTGNVFKMLHLTAEMNKVCALFHEEHVRSLMLKGPVLSEILYGDLSLRTCKDLDILVPLQDVEKAEQLLLQSGFVLDSDEVRVLSDWKWRVHHISYTHPDSKIQIELHWRLNPDKGKEPSFDELWERRRASSQAGPFAYTLGNEDLFFFLALHGARHGWFRLRWLADIDHMVRQELDWSNVLRIMMRHDSIQVGGQALLLAAELFHTPITMEMKPLTAGLHSSRLAQGAIVFMKDMITLSPVPKDLDIYYRKYLFSLRSMPQKWYLIVSLMYPNNRDLETLPLPKQLHLLYFPLRPFLWCWRRMRQQTSP